MDGLDPAGSSSRCLPRGICPTWRRCARRAGLARVATTYPAQTPVAWLTFATGTNPGGRGALLLTPLFELVFDDARPGFGYRKGRSTKDAMRKI